MMAPATVDRLRSICGRLASDHDGERAAAALLATRLLYEHNLRWQDVIGVPALPHHPAPDDRRPQDDNWRTRVEVCRRHADLMTEWEQQFLGSLSRFAILSPKQRAVLDRLYARCGGDR